jgi:hypothetical protein
MPRTIARRAFMRHALVGCALGSVLGLTEQGRAASLTPLDPNDPTAKSLGFVTDAAQVKPADDPTYKAGQHCAVCLQFQGKPTDARAACNIYAGHSVPAGGWCRVWTQRPS